MSIDIAPPLLPEDGVDGPMTFVPSDALPGLGRAVGALLTADSALRAEEVVADLVAAVVEAGASPSDGCLDDRGRRSAVERVREFFEAELHRRVTLDEAARAAGVNRFILIRQFRRTLNTTPHAYLVMLRLGRARELLAHGTPPSEAALAAGFADQAHLTRWFRRAHGIAPAAYARHVRSTHTLGGSIPFKTGREPAVRLPGPAGP